MTSVAVAVIVAALSFICQKTLGNLLYGFVILIGRPFRKGDKITLRSLYGEVLSGRVEGIGPLYTKIKHYDGDILSVPNSMLETCIIRNSDSSAGMNHPLTIDVAYGSDTGRIKEIILAAVTEHPETTNTPDNTDIVCRQENGHITFSYNVRTVDIEASYRASSDICERLLAEFHKDPDISLI